jgi:site-specific DNA-cytosine methylase
MNTTQTKNKFSITHFIPLIGPWFVAGEQLKSEFDIEQKYVFSYDAFDNNQKHLVANYGVNIHTLPNELLPDYEDGTDNWKDISAYKKYIADNKFEAVDVLLAVPPCAGLSMLNAGNRGAGCAANKWMYETVKWNIAQNNKVLCLENAPGLVGKEGVKVLRNIQEILKYNGVADQYKIHTTKTTTMNHGLPQFRGRAFLYIYKSEEYKVLRNIENEIKTLETFLDEKSRPEKEVPGTDHVTLNKNDVMLKYIKDNNAWDEIRGLLPTDKDVASTSMSKWALSRYAKDKKFFKNYPTIEKWIGKWNKKLERGLGYWDSTPLVVKGKVNAVISKNAHRTIHPKYNRFLTVRELMDLMGYPDELKLQEPIEKNFNHICQSVPINTAMDHIRWAQGIANDDPKYVVGTFQDDDMDMLQQNNMKQDLENTFL